MICNTIFVDLQGFKDINNKFIVKELVIATQQHTEIYLVKPPYSFSALSVEEKRHVRWIERNRGYRWSEGIIDYREFHRIIKPHLKDKKIVVKGEEKIRWVKEISDHENITDIGDKNIPNLKNLHELYSNDNFNNCLSHKSVKCCALKNVLCIKKWCIENDVIV